MQFSSVHKTRVILGLLASLLLSTAVPVRAAAVAPFEGSYAIKLKVISDTCNLLAENSIALSLKTSLVKVHSPNRAIYLAEFGTEAANSEEIFKSLLNNPLKGMGGKRNFYVKSKFILGDKKVRSGFLMYRSKSYSPLLRARQLFKVSSILQPGKACYISLGGLAEQIEGATNTDQPGMIGVYALSLTRTADTCFGRPTIDTTGTITVQARGAGHPAKAIKASLVTPQVASPNLLGSASDTRVSAKTSFKVFDPPLTDTIKLHMSPLNDAQYKVDYRWYIWKRVGDTFTRCKYVFSGVAVKQ